MIKEKSGHLLIVDDEIETLTPLCDLLSEWGYEVEGYTSGDEALKAFKKQEFDVLLADLVMPEMDGIELLKAAMEIDQELVCIIISGKGTIQQAVEAMKSGAFDYILKPLEWKLLKPIISRAIETRRLRESEKQYRYIVEDQTEFIFRWKPGETLTFVNEAYCQYFNKQPEELIGHSFMPLIPEEDREMVRQHFASLSLENPVSTHEHRVFCSDGELCWQLWTNRAIFDEKGNIIEYQSVGRDITKQKKAEEKIKESEDRYRELANSISDIFFAMDGDLKYTFWNKASEDLTGIPAKDAIGKSLYELFTDTIETKYAENVYRDVLRTKKKQNFINKYHIGNKEYVFDITAYPSKRGTSVFVKDITERKLADDALIESEKKFKTLSEQSPNMIFINKKGVVVYANKRCEEVMGYTLEEFYSHDFDFRTLIAPESRELIEEKFNKYMSGEEILPYEAVLITKKGEKINTIITTKIIDYESEKAILGIITDITECKLAEEELKEEQYKLREYFEYLPLPAYNITFDGKIADCNNVAVSILGYDNKDELIGKQVISTVYAPSSQEKAKQLLEKWKKWGKLKNEELQIITKQGEIKDVLLNVATIYDHMGNPLHSISTQLDITERKQAGEHLQFLSSMVEQSLDSIISTDTDFRITYMNKSAEKLFGWSLDELRGKTPDIINAEPNADKIQKQIYTAISSGNSYFGEALNRRKDGSTFYCQFRVSPLFNKNGEIYGYMGAQRDVTDRVQAIESLQKSDARYRDLYDNAPDMYHTLDKNGIIVDCNKTEASMLGYRKEEIIGRHITYFFNEGSKRLFEIAFPQLKGKKELLNLEREFTRKDGTTFPASLNVFSVYDGEGKFIGTKTIARDITVLKKSEYLLRESEEKYRNLVENSIDGIAIVQGDEIKFVNKSFMKIFGVQRKEEMVGHIFTDFVSPKDRELLRSRGNARERGEKVPTHYEFKALRNDGTEFDAELSVSTIMYEGNIARQGILRDITERKQAEEALRTSEAQLSNALRVARMGHWEYDVASDLFTFNDHFYAIFRTTAEEVGGYTMSSANYAQRFVHPDDMSVVSIEIRKALETTDPNYSRQLEHRIIYADGKIGYIAVRFFIVKDDKGRTVKTYGANQDITERKQAEEALRKSEERYRSLVESLADVIFSLSLEDRTITSLNPAFEKITGWSRDEWLGRPFMPIIHQDDLLLAITKLQKVLSGETVPPFELRVLSKSGKYLVGEFTGTPQVENEKVVGMYGIARDITERKLAEEELKKSEERFRSLTEASFEAIIFHKKGILIRANNRFFKMLGYEPDELIGKQVIPKLVAPEAQEFMKEQIAGGKLGPYESIGVRKDGTKFPMEIRARQTELEGQMVRVATIMDISEYKKKEKRLKKSYNQLRNLAARLSEVEEAERRRLARELHDQVGQNLTALGINLNIMPTLISPKEVAKIKGRMKDTQKLLGETTQNIRSVMADLRPSVLDDYGLVAAIRWYSEKFSERTGIQVKTTCKKIDPRLPEFLETTLYRIAQEALTNVAKHAQASKVTVSIRKKNETIKLVISDDGIGFKPETVYKTKKQIVWGLHTMKERAEAIGGKLEIQSSPEKGAKIIVEIKR